MAMNSQRNLAANPEAHGYGRDAQAARWRIRHALTLLCPALAGSATAPSPTVPRALLAALLLAPLTEPLAAEFHVATTGSDANPGTEAKPFATLERARDEIRKLKQTRPLKEAIAVVVHGGVYHLVQPLVFTPEDSGTPDAPIVYQAAGGAEPVLSGGVAIAGWTKTAEGRWQTTLPPVAAGQWRFAQLYVDDQRRFRPVWPKEGYFFIAGRVPPSTPGWNEDGFRFRKGEIDAGWHNLSDVEAVIFHAWTISRLPIKHVDVPNSLVRFTGCTQNDSFAALTKSQWYRLENVREALQTGQWYLDRMTGVLTYAPLPGEESDSSRVIAPRLRQVVELRGDIEKGRFVEHITLRGLTFAHTAWNTPANGFRDGQGGCQEDAAVMAVNARACTLERCIVRHTGNHGVQFGAGCSSCRADGCEFFDCGMGGVKIGTFAYPNEPDARRWADNCTVRDTLVTGCGRVYPGAVGLLVGHANHCTLEQNEVRDQYYSGVSVGWRWEKGFSPAHHNLVVRNHLHHLGCGVLSDMAGIYTLGQSPGTVLAGNHIHDVNRSRYGGWGIYFDAWSSSITAQGNLVYRTQDAGLHQNYAQENIVRGNLFAFGSNGAFRICDIGKSGPLLLEGNVFVWRGAPFVEELPRGPLDAKVTFRRNLYWSMDQ
ncbi:MAG: right-handed parallel beta-helix repeat-containing protein, partial [Lentisphaerae bacterium]|nr:right-handed parallel beta-helix repeat-containing protein [Lentisphaerota bacterium]